MNIDISQVGETVSITVLRVAGNMDGSTSAEFDTVSQKVLDEGAENILLDLKNLVFMSSAGIRSINSIYYALHNYGKEDFKEEVSKGIRQGNYQAPHLKILNPPDQALKAFKLVGIDMYIGIYSDEKDAIKSFTEVAS